MGSLIDDKRLIAVTARQRAIMWRGLMKCLTTKKLFECISGPGSRLKPFYKWVCSPASIQAGEFEQTFMLNMDAFNLIRHLPILPGPLQVFRYAPLLKHEVAFVLGQLEHPAAVEALCAAVRCEEEHGMVRHEAAEALGAIGSPDAISVLREFSEHPEPILRESCWVALHMYDREAFLASGVCV